MAYTPTTWKTGDKVTAEKLNKIEQGIADAEQSGGNGIYTVVISMIHNPDSGGTDTVTVIQGDFATAIQKLFAFEPIYVWVCRSDFYAGLDMVGAGIIESFDNSPDNSYIELSVFNGLALLMWDENGIVLE